MENRCKRAPVGFNNEIPQAVVRFVIAGHGRIIPGLIIKDLTYFEYLIHTGDMKSAFDCFCLKFSVYYIT